MKRLSNYNCLKIAEKSDPHKRHSWTTWNFSGLYKEYYHILLVREACDFFIFYFLKNNLEYISPFCSATDTPVLGFWRRLPWVSMSGWIPSLLCFIACMQWIPQIYLWCDTCWPLGGQHGVMLFTFYPTTDGDHLSVRNPTFPFNTQALRS